MTRESASSHVAFWTDLTRRAPDEVRAAPASLLAFAGWLSGHGALAWCALDQVPADKPYALAALVAAAVQGGMHPREWDATRTLSTDRSVDAFTPTRAATQHLLSDLRSESDVVMEIPYRRRRTSLLERAFAGLVKYRPVPARAVVKIDLVDGIDLGFRPE